MNAELSQNQTKLLIDNFETLSETIMLPTFQIAGAFYVFFFSKNHCGWLQLGKIVLNCFQSVHFTSIHNNVTLV